MSWTKEIEWLKLKACPKCESDDLIYLGSCHEHKAHIHCKQCDYHLAVRVGGTEKIQDKWNRLKRKRP